MSTAMDFHSQIASIMEVLANAAVAEICKVVDDGYAVVHLEMSRSQKENEFLRRKIKLLELQISRYRAERVKGAEGSIGSRFPGVRLLQHRPGRDTPSGPSLQGRTKFLNRASVAQPCQQKTSQPINLDQDPDQEVVTTTKAEPSEPEEDGELLIVKVEGGCAAPRDTSISNTALKDTSAVVPAQQHSNEMEGQGFLENTRFNLKKEELVETPGNLKTVSPTVKPSLFLSDWQEHKETVNGQSHSFFTAKRVQGKPAISQFNANFSSSFPSVTSISQSANFQQGCASINYINANEDNLSSAFPPIESVNVKPTCNRSQGNPSTTPQNESMMCVQNNKPSNEVTSSPVESWQQPIEHTQTGVQPIILNTDFSNHLYQPLTNQETGPAESHKQEEACLPFACSFCPRRYAQQSQVRNHERAHTGEKPYPCVRCGKRFGHLCNLKRHQMVHTRERPFPCPCCGKRFTTSNNLKVHQSVHTGEKKFHCNQCGKSFAFLSNLIRHQVLHTRK